NPYNPQSVPNPYEQPSVQPGYGAPPTGQPGYGAPPISQPGYGAPLPVQPGYGVSPTGYGALGYEQPTSGYVPQMPQSWGQALLALPGQYLKILTKPGARSFAEEQPKATWGMIWTQLLFVGVLGTIISLISVAISSALVSSVLGSTAGTTFGAFSSVIVGSASTAAIVVVIVEFFVVVGIQYLLAKAFKGNGRFVQQGYNYLLITSPISVINYVVGLIPILGGIIAFALAIYGLVLNVFAIMATHRLSGGKATWVVLIPIIAGIVLGLLCVVVLITVLASAAGGFLHGLTGQ
ncbi:MAG: YIP1 family protein, partial [Ktedonobacteraceae bacterium]